MLQENTTLKTFGYNIDSLTSGSNKKVSLICDYCNESYITSYKLYCKGRKYVEKDACKQCRYKKREDISLKKYGVKNSAQRPDVRKKISENCEGFDDKRREAMRKKYGVSNPMHSNELKQKHRNVVRDKYGVENVSQVKEIRGRVEKTNLEKFGHKQFLASNEGKRKKLEGMQAKYGVDNAFQSKEVKRQIKQTNLANLGVDHHFKIKERALKNAQNIVKQKIKNGTIKLYGGKSISDWARQSEYCRSRFGILVNQYGLDMAKSMSPHKSYLECLMEDWLKKELIEYTTQFKVGSKFADFYLTDYNIIIETDGLYWHSEAMCNTRYHIDKHKLYIDNGYIPLFFREDEINNKFDIVTSIILNKVGKSRRIFARKCKIVELSRDNSKEFFNHNHLMGRGRGTTYGLKYNDELVSAIIIRKIRDNNYDISRFCHVLNTRVVGGFSRLVKHFTRLINPDSLTTFIDRRYGQGAYLEKLGFEYKTCYPSFKWTDTKETFHRMKFPGQSGYKKNLLKIWDCGQAKYVYYKP